MLLGLEVVEVEVVFGVFGVLDLLANKSPVGEEGRIPPCKVEAKEEDVVWTIASLDHRRRKKANSSARLT